MRTGKDSSWPWVCSTSCRLCDFLKENRGYVYASNRKGSGIEKPKPCFHGPQYVGSLFFSNYKKSRQRSTVRHGNSLIKSRIPLRPSICHSYLHGDCCTTSMASPFQAGLELFAFSLDFGLFLVDQNCTAQLSCR